MSPEGEATGGDDTPDDATGDSSEVEDGGERNKPDGTGDSDAVVVTPAANEP